MNSDEGTPVDNEVVADAVGTELTVPRREQNQINIHKFEREMAAAGTVMEDREMIAIRDAEKSRLDLKKSRHMLFILFLLTLVLLLGIGGLFAFVTAIYKDTYVVKGDTAMSNAKGEVVGTRVATHNLPLIVAPVLPDDELFSVETLRVTLPGSTTGPAELVSGKAINETVGSGETINDFGPSVVRMFRISGVEKVNSTAVVFHALGGEQIRVWNGVTTVRLSATGPEIPVCSANVTCAAFQVEGAELAEKYLAQAEALLVPFEEGRRRLAEACLDPFTTSVERGAAQVGAQDRCQPVKVITTEAACRSLADQIGKPFGRSGNLNTKGCYSYGSTSQTVYFGTGGSVAKMAEPLADDPLRHRFSEQQLSNYFNLDPHCLVLSNQAKLEATLESVSKSVSNFETLYLTGTFKVGATVTSIGTDAYASNTQITGLDISEATALQTIGFAAFSNNPQLTGTLKVGPAVTSIGGYAFYGTQITRLDISDATALRTIGNYAFYNTPLVGQTVLKADGTSFLL